MMRRTISIIGTDGSGKTTLSNEVAARLSQDEIHAARIWLGAESYLTAPARKVLRFFWKGKRRESQLPPAATETYRDEVERKNAFAQRHAWATQLYLALVLVDYRVQFAVKSWRTRNLSVVVADRYVFDVVVNIGLALDWEPQQVVALAQRQLARLPLPQVRVFLRVEPEVSMARKDDIPDIDYLRLRFQYYEAIAQAFGFVIRDGTRPIDENASWLVRHAYREFTRPYIHYVHANNTDVGGADKVLVLMAKHMREYGIELNDGFRTSVSLRLPTAVLRDHAEGGTPVILHRFVRPQLSAGVRGLVSLTLRSPATLIHFIRFFRRERPDLVHVNDIYDYLPALAAKVNRIPVVYHLRMIHGNAQVSSGFSRLIPWLSTTSVSVSSAVRDHYFSAETNTHAKVIHDLGNNILTTGQSDVSVATSRPVGLPNGKRLVLMVGRMEPWKGQDLFLDAVAMLPADVRVSNSFALVGGAVPGKIKFFDDIRNRSAPLGVAFLGARDDVPELLRSADISVHCSVSPDPFPGVVIESLLSGAATIAANSGGVPEIIGDDAAGVLTAPGNAADLCAALTRLLTCREPPRRIFGSTGRARALSLVDPEVIDRQLAILYHSIAPKAHAALLSPPSTAISNGRRQ